jgi:hypothetical protein
MIGKEVKLIKNLRFTVSSIFIIIFVLLNIPLILGQNPAWYCQVSAYGTNVLENEFAGSVNFDVVTPPSGSNISNTIIAQDLNSGENYTINLSPDENVLINFSFQVVESYDLIAASEPDNYYITYVGEAIWLQVNGTEVPEFPPILIVPMFIAVTLLAILYRRKR